MASLCRWLRLALLCSARLLIAEPFAVRTLVVMFRNAAIAVTRVASAATAGARNAARVAAARTAPLHIAGARQHAAAAAGKKPMHPTEDLSLPQIQVRAVHAA